MVGRVNYNVFRKVPGQARGTLVGGTLGPGTDKVAALGRAQSIRKDFQLFPHPKEARYYVRKAGGPVFRGPSTLTRNLHTLEHRKPGQRDVGPFKHVSRRV